jgi:hypothetical protein
MEETLKKKKIRHVDAIPRSSLCVRQRIQNAGDDHLVLYLDPRHVTSRVGMVAQRVSQTGDLIYGRLHL